MRRECVQINLQSDFGGGEIYTGFLTRALADLGWHTTLYTSHKARYWEKMDLRGARLERIESIEELNEALDPSFPVVITHGSVNERISTGLCHRHSLWGIAHMPADRNKKTLFANYSLVTGVSNYVIDTLVSHGVSHVHPEPLYGIADLSTRPVAAGTPKANSPYSWDKRKFRDRFFSYLEPLVQPLRPRPQPAPAAGISLGIVSRLTPIKQFPLMFGILADVIAAHPLVRLEIFGSGGYASVRDLRRALRPLGDRARFWGHQDDVRRAYAAVDFVLSGLPEREALGLNLIEAQACGTPVLAVNAPPFTETVDDGRTGFLYRDPREDGGADFDRLLTRLEQRTDKLAPQQCTTHLARFSPDAFRDRLRVLLDEFAVKA